ncbi:hypothetical protein LTR86_006633 [Recurvomyces mirabilis]|nr:hypothetical protein LTR86_006633 [Recurvomyces mirabilis]
MLSIIFILAFASAAIAAPASITQARNGAANYNVPQIQIRDLELTIINLTNDIVQSNSTGFATNYALGTTRIGVLSNGVQGAELCGPYQAPVASGHTQAISYLQNATVALQQLSWDLMGPALIRRGSVQLLYLSGEVQLPCPRWLRSLSNT